MNSHTFLNHYRKRTYDFLSPEKEEQLFKEFRNGSLKAKERIFNSYVNLVVGEAVKRMGYNLDLDDLIQEGSIALMQAIESYDPEKGKLISFATSHVKGTMNHFVMDNYKSIRFFRTKPQMKIINNINKYMVNDRLNEDGIKQICKDLCVEESDVRYVYTMMFMGWRSYNHTDARTEDIDIPYEDYYVAMDNKSSPENVIQAKIEEMLYNEGIDEAVSKLDKRKQYIIKHLYLENNIKTKVDISKKLKISSERVDQVRKQAINEMKKSLKMYEGHI